MEKTCVQYEHDPPSYDSLETDTAGLPAYQDVLAELNSMLVDCINLSIYCYLLIFAGYYSNILLNYVL